MISVKITAQLKISALARTNPVQHWHYYILKNFHNKFGLIFYPFQACLILLFKSNGLLNRFAAKHFGVHVCVILGDFCYIDPI